MRITRDEVIETARLARLDLRPEEIAPLQAEIAAILGFMATLASLETGGSIRQPASLCSVTGLRPTYGRVSRYGLVAHASSLDQVGPFGRSVGDCALALEAIAGPDPRDATSLPAPVPRYRDAAGRGVRGLRLGVPAEYFGAGLDPEVAAAAEEAIAALGAAGAQVVPVSLPHTEYAIAAYYLIATAEASSNLQRYDGVRHGLRVARPTLRGTYCATRAAGFGPEVKRRLMLGTFALRAGTHDRYYRKAQCVRTLVREDFRRAFAACDLLAAPTAPVPAFRFGEKRGDPLAMYRCDAYTTPGSLAGLPELPAARARSSPSWGSSRSATRARSRPPAARCWRPTPGRSRSTARVGRRC